MVRVITMLSRYILTILCALFAYTSFVSINDKEKSKKALFVLQKIIMYMIHFVLLGVIYVNTNDIKIIIFYIFQVAYFILYDIILKAIYKKINVPLLNLMFFMLMIGFSMLLRISYNKAVKQFVICVVASIITGVIPYIISKSKKIRSMSYIFGVFGIGALSLVLVIGKETLGAKLSLDLHFIAIQPSEFVKITFVIFLSGILFRYRNFRGVVISGIFAAIHVIILVVSKDLGTALILCITYLFLVYMSTGNKWYLFGGLILGSGASVVAYKLFSHVKVRVEAWYNPWPIIDGKGYQITQSLFAIGTGGLFGSGLYQGLPSNIPVVEQDFIISAFAEELGTFFAISVISISLCIFMICIKIAMNCQDSFYKLTVAALAVSYGFQVFFTVGSAIKLIPSTGVTYPLLSYGGSSLLATICVFAIIQGVYINENADNK